MTKSYRNDLRQRVNLDEGRGIESSQPFKISVSATGRWNRKLV
ncbi:hypothetical protein [Holospora undulata]|nr:hypothetical protein [Holospora undulata]